MGSSKLINGDCLEELKKLDLSHLFVKDFRAAPPCDRSFPSGIKAPHNIKYLVAEYGDGRSLKFVGRSERNQPRPKLQYLKLPQCLLL